MYLFMDHWSVFLVFQGVEFGMKTLIYLFPCTRLYRRIKRRFKSKRQEAPASTELHEMEKPDLTAKSN